MARFLIYIIRFGVIVDHVFVNVLQLVGAEFSQPLFFSHRFLAIGIVIKTAIQSG